MERKVRADEVSSEAKPFITRLLGNMKPVHIKDVEHVLGSR